MAKYIGPRIKIIRRLGVLPGLVVKSIKNRKKTPGQHGKLIQSKTKRSSLSDDYRNRLIEKQKLRFNYGITENQLLAYYLAAKKKSGSTGKFLLEFLEARIDCVVCRLGFAPTIPAARQLVNHGHIVVNNKKVTIPSFLCKKGDKISVSLNTKSRGLISSNLDAQLYKRKLVQQRMKHINLSKTQFHTLLPAHLDMNIETLDGIFLSPVRRQDMLLRIDELKVVEYYSR